MSARKRSLGTIASDLAWFAICAMSVSFGLTHDWAKAFGYVLLGVLVLTLHDVLNEWRDAMTDRIEKRREGRATR